VHHKGKTTFNLKINKIPKIHSIKNQLIFTLFSIQ
jgi:hypothetical protein